MTDSEGEDDGWEQGSRDEEQSEDGTDDVQEVEASGTRASTKPILRFPERNDEDTFWTRTDETKPACVKNKFKSEDMTRVRQRKELLLRNVHDALELLSTSTSGVRPIVILTVGGDGI